MSSSAINLILRLARAAYRQLLYGYPAEFRARYGDEMVELFTAQLRESLARRGVTGLLFFALRMARDWPTSVLRERLTIRTLIQLLNLAVAFAFAAYAAYVDHHNVRETYPTLAGVLAGSLIMGFSRPRWAWRWAIIVGIGVPFFGPLLLFPGRLASPDRWAMLAVVMIPGLIGAYAGSTLRRAAAAA